jgi:hypothetical protein
MWKKLYCETIRETLGCRYGKVGRSFVSNWAKILPVYLKGLPKTLQEPPLQSQKRILPKVRVLYRPYPRSEQERTSLNCIVFQGGFRFPHLARSSHFHAMRAPAAPDSAPPRSASPQRPGRSGRRLHSRSCFAATLCESLIHEQTTRIGHVSANSVSRELHRFWNGFGQGSSPARRIMRLNCVRRFWLPER